MQQKKSKLYTTVLDMYFLINRHKAMSFPTIYKHLHALRIKPLGQVRQCPQLYPPDAALRILARLGIRPKRSLQG